MTYPPDPMLRRSRLQNAKRLLGPAPPPRHPLRTVLLASAETVLVIVAGIMLVIVAWLR